MRFAAACLSQTCDGDTLACPQAQSPPRQSHAPCVAQQDSMADGGREADPAGRGCTVESVPTADQPV